MAKAKRRGPSLEDKYLGGEPNYHGQELKGEELSKAFSQSSRYFNYYNNAKSNAPVILIYAEKVLGFSKKDIQALKKVENWRLNQGTGNNIRCINAGIPLDDMPTSTDETIPQRIEKHLRECLKLGKSIVTEQKAAAPAVVITPRQRMEKKVIDTIWADFDEMVVDKWMDGEYDKIKFPAYSLLQVHKIKGAGVNIFADRIQFELDLVSDAYNKTCDQAVEAYSHVSKGNKKKMMTLLEKILEDVARAKLNAKSARVPRAKKRKASDEQVAKLQYKTDDVDAKLTSINPVMIPGKERLFTYNTKTRKLTEYYSTTTAGFEVKGTSIKNFDDKLSKTTKLRKPEDVLPNVLTLAPTKIQKQVWDKLTTKINAPNGRINADTILLRVL